jgi:hypothetical protein
VIGDDVVARLKNAAATEHQGIERVLVRHFVKRTAKSFELRQFSPDLVIRVATDEVKCNSRDRRRADLVRVAGVAHSLRGMARPRRSPSVVGGDGLEPPTLSV